MLLKLILVQAFLCSILTLHYVDSATDKVLCYYESWASGSYAPEEIDVNICTHILFSFMGINADGSLRLDGNDDIIKRLVALKSRKTTLKIILSVGGWSEGSEPFSKVAADSTKKATLAKSCLEYFRKYKLDGIDIDWEYPGTRGGTPDDKENFIDLLWVLRNAFNAAGGYIITIATSGIPTPSSYNVKSISQVVDAINVMTYAFHQAPDNKTGQNSPLYGSSTDTDWEKQYANCDSSITNWLDSEAAPEKLILGLAFYGYSFQLADPKVNGIGAPTVGVGKHGDGYNKICKLTEADGWTEVWDDEQKVPYKYSGDQWIGYDNPRSIALKVQYAKSRNLGGVMMWALDHDDTAGACGTKSTLLKTIKNTL